MPDTTSPAVAVSTYNIVLGIAGAMSMLLMAKKFEDKKISTGTLITALTLTGIVTLMSVSMLREEAK